MKQSDHHAQTIERALASIAPHEDEKSITIARQVLLGELKRIEESEAAFHQLAASVSCRIISITFGCTFSTGRMAEDNGPAPHAHAATATARETRTPVAWGGSACWRGEHCWVCIEYECHT